MKQSIVVFGISGVGKTTACKSFVGRNPEFGYVSVSEVLRRSGGFSVEQLSRLSRSDILKNQALLIQALPAEMAKFGKAAVLVDAQNVIDNGVDLVEVPISTVEALGPRGFILLEADPGTVWQRRKNDVRPRPNRTLAEIADQTLLIHRVARDYSEKLDVPLITASVIAGFEIDAAVREMLPA